jgi:hypothetical protein
MAGCAISGAASGAIPIGAAIIGAGLIGVTAGEPTGMPAGIGAGVGLSGAGALGAGDEDLPTGKAIVSASEVLDDFDEAIATAAEPPMLPERPKASASRSALVGICTAIPQCGQIPRLPARKALTLSLCPLGQWNLMPIRPPDKICVYVL